MPGVGSCLCVHVDVSEKPLPRPVFVSMSGYIPGALWVVFVPSVAVDMTCRFPECVNVALLTPTPHLLPPLDFPGVQALSSRLASALPNTELLVWSVVGTVITGCQPSGVSPCVTLNASVAGCACESLHLCVRQ